MSELPSFLPGVQPMYGLKQPAPEFNQGSDVIVEFPVNYNGDPFIDVSSWELELFVKKSLKAANVLWRCDKDTGLYQKSPATNIFYFRIPADITARFLPGSYYFTLQGRQKLGSAIPFDSTVSLANGMFDLNLDAASPNPKLTTTIVVATIVDPAYGWRVIRESTEPTEPATPVGGGIIP